MVSWQLKHGHLLCSNFCLANLHTGEGKDTMEDSFESYSGARQDSWLKKKATVLLEEENSRVVAALCRQLKNEGM